MQRSMRGNKLEYITSAILKEISKKEFIIIRRKETFSHDPLNKIFELLQAKLLVKNIRN